MHATAMKDRLRRDLREAAKNRSTALVKTLRSLIAALDNAEAPAVDMRRPVDPDIEPVSGDIPRLALSAEEVAAVLFAEATEREAAAGELDRVGQAGRADELRKAAEIVRRYLGP